MDANENIQVIITTGGTGFTGRDSTPEALEPLFDKTSAVLVSYLDKFLLRKSARRPYI